MTEQIDLNELERSATDFLEEVYQTLCCALPNAGEEVSDVELNTENEKISAQFVLELAYSGAPINDRSCAVRSSDLYSVYISYDMGLDRSQKHLAVIKSTFQIRADSLIAIRFDYDRDKKNVPASHIHFSGTGELLSPALSRNNSKGRKSSGDLQYLHVPVGGHRFRPSLEDFLHFVIKECGFRGMAGWENKLLDRRQSWMDHQCAASVRDAPQVAVRALELLGYKIEPPPSSAENLSRHPGW